MTKSNYGTRFRKKLQQQSKAAYSKANRSYVRGYFELGKAELKTKIFNGAMMSMESVVAAINKNKSFVKVLMVLGNLMVLGGLMYAAQEPLNASLGSIECFLANVGFTALGIVTSLHLIRDVNAYPESSPMPRAKTDPQLLGDFEKAKAAKQAASELRAFATVDCLQSFTERELLHVSEYLQPVDEILKNAEETKIAESEANVFVEQVFAQKLLVNDHYRHPPEAVLATVSSYLFPPAKPNTSDVAEESSSALALGA